MHPQTIAIIPARYGSTRFPGKPLADIAGKSMIQRVYEKVCEVPGLDEVIVATDDQRIFDHVISFHGKAAMTASSHRNGTERCAEVLGQLEENPGLVLCVQGDEPLIAPGQIALVVSALQAPGAQIATLVKEIDSLADLFNPNVPKVVMNRQMEAIYFSRSPIPYLRGKPEENWLEEGKFFKHIGIYGYRAHILEELVMLQPGILEEAEQLEQLRWLEHGYRIQVALTREASFAVDCPEDLVRITELLKP